MARNKSRILATVFSLVLIFLGVSLSLHSPQSKQSRVRRQACEEYKHEGRTCCKCGAGYKLKEHCSAQKNDQICELCEDGRFNSLPNSLKTCEPCKSCSQPSANLEVAISCSRTSDTVCKCKDHHYCISDTHPCTECRPCKVCDPGVGVKVECSPTNNTICNETDKGNNAIAIVLGILCSVIAIVIVIGVYIFCRKRKTRNQNINSALPRNGVEHPEVAMEPLIVNVDLMPLIPAIAPVVGWKDMRNIAMSCNMPNGTIEAIQQNHPQDNQEQTIHLLKEWVEMEGGDTSRKLVQCLINSGRTSKAEKVKEILRNSTSSDPPV